MHFVVLNINRLIGFLEGSEEIWRTLENSRNFYFFLSCPNRIYLRRDNLNIFKIMT